MRLKNKTAVITAAGQGIGFATAKLFSEQGATVIATDINSESLANLKKICPEVSTQIVDVTQVEAIQEFFSSIKKIDILINCAGFVHHGSILDCQENDWDFSFNLNVKSMYHMIRTALPMMLSQKQGSIINIASVASSIKGVPNRFVYGTTKAAVIGLTKAVAADYVSHGVRCNAICPGTIQTPSLDNRIAAMGDQENARAQFVARQPMGRLGNPEEIAALAVYLASDESTFTTGTTHVIDGGWIG
jgi:2-keto-3-deoxy-L-fuconate dehydrogenase